MDVAVPAPRSRTARLAAGTGVAGLLLAAGLATAAPTGAAVPVEHDGRAAGTTSSTRLVNGVHTATGVAAKLARLRYAPAWPADLPSSSDVLAWSVSATGSCGGS